MVDQTFRNALTEVSARGRGSLIAQQFQRVVGAVTSFGRGNPLLATSIAGITLGGVVAVAKTRVTRRKKKAKTTRRKKRVTKRKPAKKRKRATHRSPRHKGHKRVSFINKKTGKKVSFLVRGPKRSPKHSRTRKQKRFVKGSPEAKRFMAKLRRMKR